MKKVFFVIVLFVLSLQLFSAVRKPIFENFTNCYCTPCLNVEPYIDSFLNFYYRDSISLIRYHVNWPGYDPMNNDNPADVQSRTSWYGVGSVPDIFVDGQYNMGSINYNTLVNYYHVAMAQPCFVELLLSADFDSVSLAGTLEVRVIAEQIPDPNVSNYYLFTGIVSENIPYGSGYFSKFHQVHRDLFPYGGGWPVSFSSPYPDTVILNLPFQLDNTWWHYDFDELYIVSWLQSGILPYKNIYQSTEADFATVGVEENPTLNQPSVLNIGNIYPNPFLNIAYIPVSFGYSNAILSIYDMTGRLVKSFEYIPSNGNVLWDGNNNSDEQVSPGAYRVELKDNESSNSKIIIKLN